MNHTGRGKLSGTPLKNVRRKAIDVSPETLVRTSYQTAEARLPLVMEPGVDGIDLCAWAERNLEPLNASLLEHGGILFRGFSLKTVDGFEQFIQLVSSGALEYRERSSPRSQVRGKIYTSTDYPADQSIFLHNENSYQSAWPLKIFFFCQTAPARGGETPLADCRKVLALIDPKIVDRFREKKVMYVRNFGAGVGLSWQTTFQTDDKDELETYCRRAGIEVEWKGANRLRTRQVREAVAIHPLTDEAVWFNHAAFFHVSTLDLAIGEAIKAQFDQEDLPHNTYYGDGSPIEPETMDAIREAYLRADVRFSWRNGDLLMLDNMLVAHGRAPFQGPREILVGMADLYGNRPEE